VQTWTLAESIDHDGRWTVAELAARAGDLAPTVRTEPGFMGLPRFA